MVTAVHNHSLFTNPNICYIHWEAIQPPLSNLGYTNVEEELYASIDFHAKNSEMGTISLIVIFEIMLETEADVFHIDYYD